MTESDEIKKTSFVIVTAFAAILIVLGSLAIMPHTAFSGRLITPFDTGSKIIVTALFSIIISAALIIYYKKGMPRKAKGL